MTQVTISETSDLDTCLALRFAVFVEEQGVPAEEEPDDHDAAATHLLARDAEGTPVGTARIVFLPEGIAKIGRVCVLPQMRGTGLGARLIEACIASSIHHGGISRAKLGAQVHALGFYEKLGFAAYGPVYLDAGIEHRDMARALP